MNNAAPVAADDNTPDTRPTCPNGDNCDGDYECPVCDREQIAFSAGAGPAMFVLGGMAHLARPDTTDVNLSRHLNELLDGIAHDAENMPAEDHHHLIRGLIHALRFQILNPPDPDTDIEHDLSILTPTTDQTAPPVDPGRHHVAPPANDPWATPPDEDGCFAECTGVCTTKCPATSPETPAPTPQTPAPHAPECGHPLHRDTSYHYAEGGTYATHILNALEAIHAGDVLSAEINAYAADRILWQHAETCADDLRDFIAGIAGLNERHLESLGTPIHY